MLRSSSTFLSRGVMDNRLMAMDKHMDNRCKMLTTCLSTAIIDEVYWRLSTASTAATKTPENQERISIITYYKKLAVYE